MKHETWAETFRQARGQMTRVEAAAALSGKGADARCSVSNIRDWEQGRSEPPKWVQWLIIGQLMRLEVGKKIRSS